MRRRHWVAIGVVGFLAAVAVVARTAASMGLVGIPAPDVEPDLPAPALPEASSIAAPVRIPLGTLVEQLERAVPTRFGDLDERIRIPERERTSFSFELRRQPFEVSLVDSVATLEATVTYAIRAWYDPPVLPEVSASCGTGNNPGPRLRVVIRAPIKVENDWTLSTHSRVASLGQHR
jgi:hypothetical protein